MMLFSYHVASGLRLRCRSVGEFGEFGGRVESSNTACVVEGK